MTVLAIVWLPVLVIPLVVRLDAPTVDAFNAVDYVVWAGFVVEYLAKLGLAPSRWRFIRTHALDLVVIAVPFLRPVRALRVVRLLRASTVAGGGLAAPSACCPSTISSMCCSPRRSSSSLA